jgi:hypothetical protein
MSKMPPMNGMYNIHADEPDGYIHYQTVAKLPLFSVFEDECEGIAGLLRNEISGFLKKQRSPEYTVALEEVFGEYAIGEFPSDRTMCFFVSDLDAFTPEFVRLLQTRVLKKYPLWRLVAQYDEKVMGIYPRGVWIGEQLVAGEFDENHPAYVAWRIDADAYREEKYGPLGRQLTYVRSLIPAAIPIVRRCGFSLLAAFDRYRPSDPGHSIWLLQTTSLGDLSIQGTKEESTVRQSAVGEDGTIYPCYWRDYSVFPGGSPSLQLTTYVVNPAGTHRFVLKNSEGKRIGSVRADEVVSDDDLKNG